MLEDRSLENQCACGLSLTICHLEVLQRCYPVAANSVEYPLSKGLFSWACPAMKPKPDPSYPGMVCEPSVALSSPAKPHLGHLMEERKDSHVETPLATHGTDAVAADRSPAPLDQQNPRPHCVNVPVSVFSSMDSPNPDRKVL